MSEMPVRFSKKKKNSGQKAWSYWLGTSDSLSSSGWNSFKAEEDQIPLPVPALPENKLWFPDNNRLFFLMPNENPDSVKEVLEQARSVESCLVVHEVWC